jgi:polyferredoxin
VKYATQNGMANGWTTAQMVKRGLRPRVLVYTAILMAITTAVMVSLYLRTPLKVDVIRDRGVLARMVEQGRIENVFRLQVMNATESAQRYVITVTGLPGIEIASESEVEVLATEVRSAVVRVQVPPGAVTPGSHPIWFNIRSQGNDPSQVTEKAAFLVPR